MCVKVGKHVRSSDNGDKNSHNYLIISHQDDDSFDLLVQIECRDRLVLLLVLPLPHDFCLEVLGILFLQLGYAGHKY